MKGRCDVPERLEVRLDPEYRRRLDVIMEERKQPVSTIVREMIDRTYEEVCRKRREEAAERICRMEIEDVPDPETLREQLARTYETCVDPD